MFKQVSEYLWGIETPKELPSYHAIRWYQNTYEELKLRIRPLKLLTPQVSEYLWGIETFYV